MRSFKSIIYFSITSVITTFILIVLWQSMKWELKFSEITAYSNLYYLLFWSFIPSFIGFPLGLIIAWGVKNIPQAWAIVSLIFGTICVTIISNYGVGIIIPPVILGCLAIKIGLKHTSPK